MNMRKLAYLGILSLIATTGCNKQDKEGLMRICLKSATRAESAVCELRKNFGEGWFACAALESRVSSRLRWDKELADTAINVTTNGSMIELSGRVKSPAQKQRAYELASGTVGVTEVADLMHIE